MSRTANAGDPNAERRIECLLLSMPPSVHASSYSCLLLPMSPTELPTNNPASCEPQGAPRRSSRLLAFTPRGRCESSVAARGRQCQLSISTPPSPLHAHGLACQDAGSCTEYAACTKPFCTVRWTGRGSPVPGLNHRRCFKDACITALNFSLNLALFSSARGKLLQASWAAADPSCKSPGTRAMAPSPGSPSTKASPASS